MFAQNFPIENSLQPSIVESSNYPDHSYWNIPGLLQPPELYCKPQTPITSPFEDETTRALYSCIPSPLYSGSYYATPLIPQSTITTARDHIDLPLCWPFADGHDSLVTAKLPERVEFPEPAPLQMWNTVSCIPDLVRSKSVESIGSVESIESIQHTPSSCVQERTLKRQEQGADFISRPPRQARDDIFLHQLRDIKGLSWKDIATEFYCRTGKTARIPALQMRVGRFRKRNRLSSTRPKQSSQRITGG